MSTTETVTTLKAALDKMNASEMSALLALLKLGTMNTLLTETITLASVSATVDLSTLSATLATAHSVRSVRVSDVSGGSSARVGSYVLTDASGTALDPQTDSPGVCKLSADGKTLTFAGTVKAIVISYYPNPFLTSALTARFPPNS